MSARREGREGIESADRLADLAALARAAAAADGAVAIAEEGDFAALGAALDRQARARRRRRVAAGAALLLALSFVGRRLWSGSQGGPLGYVIDGAVAGEDGYIPRVQGARAMLKFTDGTSVSLSQGSRARVASTSADGAVLRLEDGHARLSVVHRKRTRWSVEAGPFVVRVTGTEFDVRWSAAGDVLRVRLQTGVVTVLGPLTRGGVTLLPGQELVALPDEGVLRIEPASPDAPPGDGRVGAAAVPTLIPLPDPAPPLPPAVVPTLSPPPDTAPPPPPARAPAPPRDRVAPRSVEPAAPQVVGADWDRRIAGGDFEAIVREAEQRGADDCLRSLPSDRLSVLGDAARYSGRTELARRALLAQRARFAGTPAAEEAAFLLGRLAEDGRSPRAVALRWYGRYLEEAPDGAYSAEALGRKLLLVAEAAARDETAVDEARELARRYLEQHPHGPYAARARALLEGAQ